MSYRPTPPPPPVPPVPTVPPGNPRPNPLVDLFYGDIAAARVVFDRLQSPARRRGPVRTTRGDAGDRPTPGSAAALSGAACESLGAAVVAALGAGASSGPLLDRAVKASPAYGSAGPQGVGHDPERPGGGSWPPGPPPYPRPTS